MFAHGRFISTSFGLPLSGFIMSPGLLFLLVDYSFVTLFCAIIYARIKPMTSLVARPSPLFFCSVCVDNNTQKQKSSEKHGRPERINHVNDIR